MRWLKLFNPNAEIDEASPIWYWVALSLLLIAMTIVFNPGGPEAIVENGVPKNLLALAPKMTGIVLSMVFVVALLFRRCIQPPKNLLIWLLVVGDMLLFASFLEMICTGKAVTIFKIPIIRGLWETEMSITPRILALLVIALTLVGARAIAGIGVILLSVVTVIHITNVEEALGTRGICFLITGFVSLLIQLRIPGMHIDKKLSMEFLADMGRGAISVGNEARKNIQATGQAAAAGAKLVAKGTVAYYTGGMPAVTGALLDSGSHNLSGEANALSEKAEV